jgi:superfamily II DNA or RNA helicase
MTLLVRVDNRVRVFGPIPPVVDGALRKMTTYANPKWWQLKRMGLPTWGAPRTVETWRQEEDHLSFARGTLRRVREALSEANVLYKVVDKRHPGSAIPGEDDLPAYGRPLWPHQTRAVEAIVARQNCVLRSPTGSGKTSIAMAAAVRVGVPVLVVVPTGMLFDQWIDRCRDPKELGLAAGDVGMVRAKKRILKPITIAMQATLAAQGIDEMMLETFGAVIEDEVQFAPAKTFFSAIDPWPAKWRIGISADERRKDQMEFMTRDLFGEVGYEITREEVEAAGHIMEVEVRCVPTSFDAPWFRGEIAMPSFDELVDGDGNASTAYEGEDTNRFDRLLREMIADERREAKIVNVILREAREGRQVLVFCRRREHVLALEQRVSAHGIATGLMLGGQGEDERVRRRTTAGVRDGSVRVAIGTVEACGTGTDLPTLEVGVVTFPLHTNRQLLGQVRGRVCRIADRKSIARLYMMVDEKVFPSQVKAIVRAHGGPSVVWRDGVWQDTRSKR